MAVAENKQSSSQAKLMAAKRASARDLEIPKIANPRRRKKCELDDELWLKTYCADVFYNPFTTHQKRIIADCAESLQFGTKKCKAAPRGDGKSSIVKYLALKYALTRQVRFPLIIAATSYKAKKILSSLKKRLASRADTPFSQDYPLECHVARYVDPWPSRARNVTANGGRAIHVEWGADSFIVPTWEDQEPIGPILLSLGITSDDLQGCNIYDRRPGFVMLDDLDSRDSLASEDGVMAGKLEDLIDKSVAGLAAQGESLGMFMLGTVTSRSSAAFKYSDPSQKPAWSGERIAAIQKWPERTDLWEEYISLRISGKQTLDEDGQPADVFGREAHQFYLDNKEEMDSGAVLANPFNFDSGLLPDGTQKQLSALQRCYDYIADDGLNSFLTEHQNDPPEEDGPIESGITANKIQQRLSGYPRKVVPPNCIVVTQGIDVQKAGLHFVVKAWQPDATNYVIDYGFYETKGTSYGSDEGVERAIRNAILGRMEQMRDEPLVTVDGEIVDIAMTLIDSGWQSPAVYHACAEVGLGVRPAKGHGKSHGCAQPNFYDVLKRTRERQPGDGWFMTRQKSGVWLVNCDTDRWKSFEHARWLTQEGKPGAAYVFGIVGEHEKNNLYKKLPKDSIEHFSFARHLTAEIEVEDVIRGKLQRFWKAKSGRAANHYLDASYLANVAANMKGIRVLGEAKASNVNPEDRPSARELAARK